MTLELELAEVLQTLDIGGPIALEMLNRPERAMAVINYAAHARGIKNPAGYAISLWRVGFDPRPAVSEAPEAPPPPEWFEFGKRLGASVR